MPRRKLLVLPLLLTMTLALSGFAYAGWTQTLSINGTVKTGNLDVSFTIISEATELADPLNAATTTVTPHGSQTSDVNTVTVSINNAYPGYKVFLSVWVKNIGTIPANFAGFVLNNNGPPAYDDILHTWTASIGTPAELTFIGGDGSGRYLDTDAINVYSLEIDVTANAKLSTTYTFEVGIVFNQAV